MITLQTRYGSLDVPDAENDLVGRHLARYGEWAFAEVQFLAACLPADRPLKVLDIGAFVGTFGIGLSQAIDVESMIFVETDGSVTPALIDNVRRNARSKSRVVEATLTPDTVLDLVAELGAVDLIKLDTGGREQSVLGSSPSLLEPGGPSFWITSREDLDSLNVCELLLDAGFTVQYFAFPSFTPANFRGNASPIHPWGYEARLWAHRGPAASLPDALVDQQCILEPVHEAEDLRRVLDSTPAPQADRGSSDDPQAKLAELQAENEALHAVLKDAENRLEANRVDHETQINLTRLTEESMRQIARLEAEAKTANRQLVQFQRSPYWRMRRRVRAGVAKVVRAFR
jgi:hypothetical protein